MNADELKEYSREIVEVYLYEAEDFVCHMSVLNNFEAGGCDVVASFADQAQQAQASETLVHLGLAHLRFLHIVSQDREDEILLDIREKLKAHQDKPAAPTSDDVPF